MNTFEDLTGLDISMYGTKIIFSDLIPRDQMFSIGGDNYINPSHRWPLAFAIAKHNIDHKITQMANDAIYKIDQWLQDKLKPEITIDVSKLPTKMDYHTETFTGKAIV